MYGNATRTRALSLLATGTSLNAVSKQLGVSRSTLRDWRDRGPLLARSRDCPRCDGPAHVPSPGSYAYLLGQYLGDGCLSRLAKGVFALRIACDDKYPGIQSEVAESIKAIRPHRKVYFVRQTGCSTITALWKHWPCLFPQHGVGPKHSRPITLVPWQEEIVRSHAGPFLRGLFHSDGCRITNWTIQQVAGKPKRYEYPRYFLTNHSPDIIRLCTWALDLLSIAWRMPKPIHVSVARKSAVAALDRHVGPKH